jgi:hypothetical protein
MPSDQELQCSLFDLLDQFWPLSRWCRSWSDSTYMLADLDLYCLHMCQNAYIIME